MTPLWRDLLLALREPTAMAGFDDARWDLVVRQALAAGLLARLGALASSAGVLAGLPAPVRHRIDAATTLAEQQRRAVELELTLLTPVLARIDGPIVLLKGAAYAAAGLAPGRGRLFADIDLLVAKPQIEATEAALMLDGWVAQAATAYDQRYYRRWMHELPPMIHVRRQTVLDVHHDLLPPTSRLKTRPELLIAAAVPLPRFPRFSVPRPVDLVVHSAAHLFHEGEWGHGLRDLVDLDALLREHGATPGFWPALAARADAMKLARPLHYALRYAHRLLGTPVDRQLLDRAAGRPPRAVATAMDALIGAALTTAHPPSRGRGASAAAFALYIRSHWLRMPLPLLVPHLLRKGWVGAWEHVRPAAPAEGRRPV